jgi:hypothetical protein
MARPLPRGCTVQKYGKENPPQPLSHRLTAPALKHAQQREKELIRKMADNKVKRRRSTNVTSLNLLTAKAF